MRTCEASAGYAQKSGIVHGLFVIGLVAWPSVGAGEAEKASPLPESWPALVHTTFKTDNQSSWVPEWRTADASWRALYPAPRYEHVFRSDDDIDALVRAVMPHVLLYV